MPQSWNNVKLKSTFFFNLDMIVSTTESELKQAAETLSAHGEPPLLMFDYDGTLAPFVIDRDQAYPYPEAKDLIEALINRTSARVVIVSGRPVADIRRLLDLEDAIEIWGCHGWERWTEAGELQTGELPEESARFFSQLRSWCNEQGFAERLEIKPASLALHWRGLPEKSRQKLEARAREITEKLDGCSTLDIHPFDGGLEWRLPGWSKADAVMTLRGEVSAETPIAYFGDDLTDEDAFRALPEGGLPILVRNQYRKTAARLWLQPPEQLCFFLERVLEGLQQNHASFMAKGEKK